MKTITLKREVSVNWQLAFLPVSNNQCKQEPTASQSLVFLLFFLTISISNFLLGFVQLLILSQDKISYLISRLMTELGKVKITTEREHRFLPAMPYTYQLYINIYLHCWNMHPCMLSKKKNDAASNENLKKKNLSILRRCDRKVACVNG